MLRKKYKVKMKSSSKACWQPVTKIKEREETWGNKTVNQFKD